MINGCFIILQLSVSIFFIRQPIIIVQKYYNTSIIHINIRINGIFWKECRRYTKRKNDFNQCNLYNLKLLLQIVVEHCRGFLAYPTEKCPNFTRHFYFSQTVEKRDLVRKLICQKSILFSLFLNCILIIIMYQKNNIQF